MNREKQIEEMAKFICNACEMGGGFDGECSLDNDYRKCSISIETSEALYNAGYRKQSEGHWFILEYEYFTCSECGYYHPNGCDSTREAKEKLADGKVPKYCSECGAKMKEEAR